MSDSDAFIKFNDVPKHYFFAQSQSTNHKRHSAKKKTRIIMMAIEIQYVELFYDPTPTLAVGSETPAGCSCLHSLKHGYE